MKSRAVVSEKGQVTIPKRLRQRLGILPGTHLRFEERDGALIALPLQSVDPFDALVGTGEGRDANAAVTELRGPSWGAR